MNPQCQGTLRAFLDWTHYESWETEARLVHSGWARRNSQTVLYARIKVHSHASHIPLSCALSGICHASQARMCNLRRMSHVLNSLKIPIYGNFLGASRHPCALC